jgi:hypothetical protein
MAPPRQMVPERRGAVNPAEVPLLCVEVDLGHPLPKMEHKCRNRQLRARYRELHGKHRKIWKQAG